MIRQTTTERTSLLTRSLVLAVCVWLLLASGSARSQGAPNVAEARITVDAGKVLNRITPWMTGSCIEDVNHEIYGGLYDQKIFGESFEEPPAAAKFQGWTAYGGVWRVDGQVCHVAADAGGKLVQDAPDFTNGTVEADVKTPYSPGDNAGLLVRIQNPGIGADNFDGYEISLSASSGQLILGKHRHDWRPLQTVAAPVEPGRWHHLRVDLQGPHLCVYMDRRASPLIDYTDTDRPILSGRIALRTWNADASFRNVSVQTGSTAVKNQFSATAGYSVSGQWDVIRTGTAVADFLRDGRDPFNGVYSQKIVHGRGNGLVGVANRGLNRWGIVVRSGQRFRGRIALRAKDLQGPVTIALQSADGTRIYATRTIRHITMGWAKYPFTLTSRAADKNARFAIWLDRPGILWADQVVLMGTGREQFKGLPVRADIADALIREGVTFLRYGGSMVNAPGYRWKNMIGDPDKRPPYVGTWYPSSTNGFGIFDFLNFCEAAHIGAAFAINIEETAQDAADLADYLTGPVTTEWGRKRAEDGHPAPYHVQYIEIGNEENIPGSDPSGFAHYADRFTALAKAIHGRNPGLKLVCAAWWTPDSPAMRAVFDAINGRAAAWDLHVGADDVRSGTDVDRQLTRMQALFKRWDPNTTLKAVIFEENGGRHDMQRALGHAATLNAARRHGDFVLADCPANCLQPWKQNDNGWDQGQVFFTPDHVWAMPPYYAQQMSAQTYEPLCAQSDFTGSDNLDLTAIRSADGRTLMLNVVNTGADVTRASVSLMGFAGCKSAVRVWTLAGDLQAANPPHGPATVISRQSVIGAAGTEFSHVFPAHSYTILRLTR